MNVFLIGMHGRDMRLYKERKKHTGCHFERALTLGREKENISKPFQCS